MWAKGGDIVADVLGPGLRVVFCGTRPSTESARRQAYYARPGNRFWPTLHAIGLTPRLFRPDEYPGVLGLGIGLTDVAKTSAGQDATMLPQDIDVARLWTSIRRFQPRILAFTSKTAAGHGLQLPPARLGYGAWPKRIEGIEVHILPSTSGLATSYWDLTPWRALAARVGETSHATA